MTPSPVASSSNISPPSLVVYPPVSNEDRASAPLLEPSDLEEGSAAENGDVPEAEEDEWDGMTPLDETLERIGMGRYQKRLLVLCGFGWMADNMWLQGIAVILPRVKEHWNISDRWIGLMSASTFAGMMVGAWGWGSYSDAQGRTPAFNLTLLLTSVFGLLSAFAPSFSWLCAALFLLGTGVGGSMPTDGTLFLENVPKTHHYLLTALSAFFSIGAVLTSLLGLWIIPRYSCPEDRAVGELCDQTVNLGWRYMLGSLAVVSIVMSLCRIILFRLQESAKFLVTSGRHREAIIALQHISRINGDPVSWSLADVVDKPPSCPASPSGSSITLTGRASYESTGESPRDGSPGRGKSEPTKERRVEGRDWVEKLPPGWRDGVDEYLARLDELFEPKWKKTTILVWCIWGLASAGYTIFNVFLPSFLEQKIGSVPGSGGRVQSLRDYVLYTVSGIPGSFLGAYLIETSWGRIKTLAFSTLATAFGELVFVLVDSQTGVVLSSMLVSLAATLMYAVIYGYTPEAFPVSTRGTACGIASAASRLAGIIAPMLTGILLSINVSAPLFLSSVCFFITAVCAFLLPIETRSAKGRGAVAMH